MDEKETLQKNRACCCEGCQVFPDILGIFCLGCWQRTPRVLQEQFLIRFTLRRWDPTSVNMDLADLAVFRISQWLLWRSGAISKEEYKGAILLRCSAILQRHDCETSISVVDPESYLESTNAEPTADGQSGSCSASATGEGAERISRT